MTGRGWGLHIAKAAACLLLLGLTAGPAHAGDGCVILQYHHVSRTTPEITSVTPERFESIWITSSSIASPSFPSERW